jgi:hypothetical protein
VFFDVIQWATERLRRAYVGEESARLS